MNVIPGDIVEIIGQNYENMFYGETGVVDLIHDGTDLILVHFPHRWDLHRGNGVANKTTDQYWWVTYNNLRVVTPVKLLDLEEML
jgi:hypothetical protein